MQRVADHSGRTTFLSYYSSASETIRANYSNAIALRGSTAASHDTAALGSR